MQDNKQLPGGSNTESAAVPAPTGRLTQCSRRRSSKLRPARRAKKTLRKRVGAERYGFAEIRRNKSAATNSSQSGTAKRTPKSTSAADKKTGSSASGATIAKSAANKKAGGVANGGSAAITSAKELRPPIRILPNPLRSRSRQPIRRTQTDGYRKSVERIVQEKIAEENSPAAAQRRTGTRSASNSKSAGRASLLFAGQAVQQRPRTGTYGQPGQRAVLAVPL